MTQYSNNQRNRSNRSSSQSTMGGLMNKAKERPVAAAAAVGAAAAAGVFLWSKRNQIGEQISSMSDQLSERSDNIRNQQPGSASYGSAGSPSPTPGRSATPMGAETRQPELAGAGAAAPTSSASTGRATGGRSGKAQGGQPMSPSRDSTPGSNI